MKYLRNVAILCLALFSPYSDALLLTPGNYLDVYFSFNSQPSQDIDVFSYVIHGINIQNQGLISTSLYDNGQFVASYNDLTQGYTRVFGFTPEGSLYTFNNPTMIDFEPLRNGTINGMFRFQTDTGQFDINPYFSNLSVGISTNYNSYYYSTSWSPVINAAVLTPKVVPVPSAILLLISGIIGLISFNRNKSICA